MSDAAANLDAELKWFFQVLEARMHAHFGRVGKIKEPLRLPPPALPEHGSAYSRLVREHGFGVRERLVLMLAFAPHLRPALLDPLFTRNSTYDRQFTEFGGVQTPQGGFAPTLETALFLLAGDSLDSRIEALGLFEPEHPFIRLAILDLAVDPSLPPGQRYLRPTASALHVLLTGEAWRPRFGHQFPARRLTTCLIWDDLVLSTEARSRVEEVVAWMDHGRTLLEDWDLGRHLKPGYRALFTGPPGTGKTLTATLLGKRTGRDVYRVDLSMVVSKYIGETEKNLEGIFTHAEERDWLLFFDEADALFGKRTDVRDSHDRYANQETSYLLQRVEDFPGVVILATNLQDNIDSAFLRRFQTVVHFAIPLGADGARLWQQGFGERCKPAADVDFTELSERFRISGGAMMNVVRFCALRAVQRGDASVPMRDIEEGIRRELQKEGRTA